MILEYLFKLGFTFLCCLVANLWLTRDRASSRSFKWRPALVSASLGTVVGGPAGWLLGDAIANAL